MGKLVELAAEEVDSCAVVFKASGEEAGSIDLDCLNVGVKAFDQRVPAFRRPVKCMRTASATTVSQLVRK